MERIRILFPATALAALLASCGGPDQPALPSLDLGGHGQDSLAGDALRETVNPEAGAVDGASDGGFICPKGVDCLAGDTAPDAGTGGQVGDPCGDGADCASGLCIDTGAGGSVCTEECIEECPAGYTCKGVPLYGADLVFLCIPSYWTLCEPCLEDADCELPGTACLDGGAEGPWCSVACAADGDCPQDFACVEDGDGAWCRPASGACTCLPGDLGLEEPCDVENEHGTCEGTRLCQGAAGWTPCDAAVPAAELCDATDNNCNGVVDEGFPLQGQPCDGPDTDLCAGGTLTCTAAGTDLECVNDLDGDAPELCGDDLDNDCDGATDEGFEALGTPCDGEDGDLCAEGAWTCTPDALALECVNDVNGDSLEACNGLDDDCDAATDEDWPLLGLPCDGPDADLCATGSWTCAEDAADVECTNEAGAMDEVCDGQDNDCDGTVDEGFLLLGLPCDGIDADLCENGTWTCAADGGGETCVNETTVNIPESCNGLDDDCDGSVDEDFPAKGQACDGGDTDFCENGILVCTAGGEALECPEPLQDIPEICNGLDDDCDGVADEGFPLQGLPCDGDDGDLCQKGTWTCTGDGGGVECVNESPAEIPESCNGLDDDCDGAADEGFPLQGQPCDGDDADLCAYGAWTCTGDGGGVECVNENPSGVGEVCNGKDDDCDGVTDEGFPLKGQPCDGADGDLCQYGTWTCTGNGAGVECVNENPSGVAEVCNSKDDDCDGVTDEGFPLKGQPCDGADSDLCQNGTHTCSGNGAGVECVNENPVNIPEVCNNKDDDCNGSVDPENSGNCTSYRRDQDNDTFGDANSPAKCYCAPTGVYKVTSSTDCYDQNGNAHPGQTGWFSTHRGDGSFDYDCSGSAEKRWTAVSGGCELFGDLCSGVPGWSGSAPACGAGGTWRDNCHWVFDWPPCRFDNASRTQQCH